MELISIALARVVEFVEVRTVDPAGKTSTPELFNKVAARYSFAKAPKSLEEMDVEKGVDLSIGKLAEINIDRLSVYSNGILLDTRSSTDDCEKVLVDLWTWIREELGVTIEPTRRNYASQIIFRSDLRLSLLNPVLAPIADRISKSVSLDLKQAFSYEPTAILMGSDSTQTKLSPFQFSVERRVDTPFFENTYFSIAPLKTAEHLEILKQFEDATNNEAG